jgi:hypothetical protein
MTPLHTQRLHPGHLDRVMGDTLGGGSMGQGRPLPCLREADVTGPVRRALGSQSVTPTDWQLHPFGRRAR